MRPFWKQFDVTISKFVAIIPEIAVKPLETLGYLTLPSVWAGSLVLFALVFSEDSLALTLSVLAFIPLATIIKFLFKRQRPPTIFAGNMRIKSYSFPSSHAYSSALGGGFLASRAWANELVGLGVLALMLAVTVGVSRIRVGAHYPSDVLAGWVLGVAVLGLVYVVI